MRARQEAGGRRIITINFCQLNPNEAKLIGAFPKEILKKQEN
jgi:hypothetical protein